MISLAIFVLLLFLYSLVSKRLERTVVTAPIVFTVAGMLMFPRLQGMLRPAEYSAIFLVIAELGLVMLLFTEASRTGLKVLQSIRNLPTRLLGAGLPLTIVLGAVLARLVFPSLTLWEAGILGAVLAPTDAGLGQIVMDSPRVPARIRQGLKAETGLNDGLSVPFLLFFIALAAARTPGHIPHLSIFILEELGIGALVGAAIGLVGGWLLEMARRRDWIAESFLQIGVVALPLLCVVMSQLLGGSMFIAAFVAGLAVQIRFKEAGKHSVEFAEEWGQLLNLSVFFVFGLVIVRHWPQFGEAEWLYAVLSLTVVRMLPVAIALMGTRLSAASVIFMGWFGPRGLASIVLGLVYLEQEMHLPGEATMQLAVIVTVMLSIFAHGFSAVPGINLYAGKIASLGPDAPEHQGVGA